MNWLDVLDMLCTYLINIIAVAEYITVY